MIDMELKRAIALNYMPALGFSFFEILKKHHFMYHCSDMLLGTHTELTHAVSRDNQCVLDHYSGPFYFFKNPLYAE